MKKIIILLILMQTITTQAQGNCIVPGYPGCTRDDFDRALQIQQQQQQFQQQQYLFQQQQQLQQQQLQEMRRSNQIQQQMLEEQQFNNMMRPMRPVN
jgi:hypothetical protein